MTLTDFLMILATALSPVIAVQVTKYLDDRNEKRGRKLRIFKALMATRLYITSLTHVEALNSIDLEFSPKKPKDKAVLDVWQQYLDHLGNTQVASDAWSTRRIDIFVDLLFEMGKTLDYDFNKTQIKNSTYSPMVHGRIGQEEERIRTMVLELLEGRRDLPMRVTNLYNQGNPYKSEL
jgi:hypothetical protein